jgi:hypothetical protein
MTALVIRASSLASYVDCPRRGIAKIAPSLLKDAGFDLNRTPQNVGACVGTAVHAGVEVSYAEKMRSGDLAPETAATDAAIDALRKEASEGVVWDGTTGDMRTAERQVQRMLRAYRRDIAPGVAPITIEQRLQAELAPGVIVSGRADQAVHEPGGIRDTKTGVMKRSHVHQLGIYSLLRRSHGHQVDMLLEDFVPRVSVHKDQPPALTYTYNPVVAERAALATAYRVAADVEAFRASGDPHVFLANPASQLCSAKYCPAHGTKWCREHGASSLLQPK